MVARRTPQPVGGVLERVRNGAQSLKHEASDTAEEVSKAIREEVGDFFNQRKDKAASKIQEVGSLIDKAGRILHAGKIDAVAEYADQAAEEVQKAAQYLDEHDFDEMARDAGEFVTRHPVPVFAGVFVLGLLAARFMKASQDA